VEMGVLAALEADADAEGNSSGWLPGMGTAPAPRMGSVSSCSGLGRERGATRTRAPAQRRVAAEVAASRSPVLEVVAEDAEAGGKGNEPGRESGGYEDAAGEGAAEETVEKEERRRWDGGGGVTRVSSKASAPLGTCRVDSCCVSWLKDARGGRGMR
jgi:hypothetical protein